MIAFREQPPQPGRDPRQPVLAVHVAPNSAGYAVVIIEDSIEVHRQQCSTYIAASVAAATALLKLAGVKDPWKRSPLDPPPPSNSHSE